jgi:integrase
LEAVAAAERLQHLGQPAIDRIALPAFALDALRQHRVKILAEGNITAPVFCTRSGNYTAKSSMLNHVFKPLLARANRKAVESANGATPALLPTIRFHDLRHTCATLLLSLRSRLSPAATATQKLISLCGFMLTCCRTTIRSWPMA